MRDRFPVVMVAGLVILAVLGSFLLKGARRGAFADRLSTFRSEPDGARALYLLLEAQHLPVSRNQKRLEIIEPGLPLVLLGEHFAEDRDEAKRAFDGSDAGVDAEEAADDTEDFNERGFSALKTAPLARDEREKLLEHVRNGATVVYVPWSFRDNPFLDALDVELIRADATLELRTLVPAQPNPFTRGVEQVEARVKAFLSLPPGAVPLLVDAELDQVVCAAVPWGQGRVIILGAPELAMNKRLATADNARFWSTLVGALGKGPVAFDEFHHGFTGDRSMGEFAARYGLQYAIAQLLVGVALWALALKRFGRPQLPREDLRVGSTDALFATSRIYREGKHVLHAAQAIAREAASELAARAGVAGHATTDEIVAGLEQRGRADLAQLLRALTTAAASATLDEDVRTVAKLAAHARRALLHTKRTTTT